MGIHFQLDSRHIALGPHPGLVLLDDLDTAFDAITGKQRLFQRHGGTALNDRPWLALARVFRRQGLGSVAPGKVQCALLSGIGPLHPLFNASQFSFRVAAHWNGLKGGTELLHCQGSPGIGRGGVPMTLPLPSQCPGCQPWNVGPPLRLVQQGQDTAHRIFIHGNHQPPESIIAFSGEPHRRPLQIQAGTHDLTRPLQLGCPLRNAFHPFENVYPVQHCRGRPVQWVNRDRPKHVRRGETIAG